jgi:mannose-6-phosphate isomerase-like protein (cupin superfamily)
MPTPKPQSTAPAQQRPAAAPAATRATMTILVTDRQGKPIPGVDVGVTGPAERDGKTDETGTVAFRNMGGGTYRLRFEHPEFITFEREVSMQAGRTLRPQVALSPAPAPAPPPEPEEAKPAPSPPPELPPPGSQPPTVVSVPDVFEANPIGRDPSRTSLVGCAGVTTATLIQVRDPLTEHTHDDADEALYVVAGVGVQRIAGRDVPLTPGTLAMVPRGAAHTITRQGSKVLVLLSMLSGPACTAK